MNKTWPYFATHTPGCSDTIGYQAWLGSRLACQATTFYLNVAITFEEIVLKSTFPGTILSQSCLDPMLDTSTGTIHIFLWESMDSDRQSSWHRWGHYLMEIHELYNMYLPTVSFFTLLVSSVMHLSGTGFALIASAAQRTHTCSNSNI